MDINVNRSQPLVTVPPMTLVHADFALGRINFAQFIDNFRFNFKILL